MRLWLTSTSLPSNQDASSIQPKVRRGYLEHLSLWFSELWCGWRILLTQGAVLSDGCMGYPVLHRQTGISEFPLKQRRGGICQKSIPPGQSDCLKWHTRKVKNRNLPQEPKFTIFWASNTSLKLSKADRIISWPPLTRQTAARSSKTRALVLQTTEKVTAEVSKWQLAVEKKK